MVVTTNIGITGVIGVLSLSLPGKCIMFRADMDGLPIQEAQHQGGRSKKDFMSKHNNSMHACGHVRDKFIPLSISLSIYLTFNI